MKHLLQTVKNIFEVAPVNQLWVIQLFASIALYNLAGLLPPIATSGIIAVLTENKEFILIWLYAILYLIFYGAQYAFLAWNYHAYVVLSRFYYDTIQQLLFEHVSNNDTILTKVSRGKISDTCSEDVSQVVYAIDSTSIVITGLIQLIIVFFIFASYNIFAAIAALGLDLFYMYLMLRNSKNVSKCYEGTRKYQDKIIDILTQMLGNLRQVKTLNIMPNLTKKLQRFRNQYAVEYAKKYKFLTRRYCEIPILVHIGKIALYVFLAYLVAGGHMTLDKLVLLISYYELVMNNTHKILEEILELDNYSVRIKRIKAILDYASTGGEEFDGDIENDYINGVVEFNHVDFEKDGRKILNNVSFKALPNKITAIVGHPGAGKTTIVNLLYRLYHVKAGAILIDDESIYNYSRKIFSNNISGVFQKSFVFKMSIRDNLSLVDSDLEHQIVALKRVGLYEDILRLPYGINTVIDDNVDILTAGQLQKLSIARALLTRAEILLFDEVTSSIDPVSSKDIIEILKDLRDDHTIIIITHKPEIMELADEIVVLKNGKVVAKGDNKTVFEKSALYRELRTMVFAQPSVNDDLME